MKYSSKYFRMLTWGGVAILSNWLGDARAQTSDDSLNIIKMDQLGILAPARSIKFPRQNDAVSFAELLPGTPGVQVTETGVIGAAPLLMIRGINTINLKTGPTIYIDGIPVKYARELSSFLSSYEPSRFGFLNINDIWSVNVLKDAKDLSALGGRGANGAIYLTTDRGEFGGTKIEFTANTGFLRAGYKTGRMGADQFKTYLASYLKENGASDGDIAANPVFNPSAAQYNNNTDWVDMVTRPGRYNDYHVKLKGGSGDANYMFSVGHMGRTGTIEASKFNRTSMRFNLDYKLSSRFEISNNLSYSNTGSRYSEEGYNWGIHPFFTAVTKAPFLNSYSYNDEGVQTRLLANVDVLGKSNPLALVQNMRNSNEENRVDGIISGLWHIEKGLSLNTSLSVSYYNMRESQYRPALGIVADRNRIRQNANRNSSEFTFIWNSYLLKTGSWSGNINYKGQLGAWFETYEDKALYARKINAGTDDYETLKQGIVDSASNIRFRSNLNRLYFDGSLDFFNRLSLSANINAEGSSNFGPKGRWALYGGADLLFDLLDRSKPHQLAIRVGAGRTGNHDVRGYYQDNLYYAISYFGYGGVYLGNVANEWIKPEFTNAIDAGIRLSLFRRRLDIDAGYYHRTTKNLITFRNYPIELGIDPQFENSGTISARGLELSVTGRIIDNSKITWSVYGSLSTLKNTVDQLENGDIIRSIANVSGIARQAEPIGSFYGYRIKGVFQSAADVNLKKADGTAYKPGDYIVEDLNGDGKINELDRQIIGNPLPNLYGGFGTGFRYKQVSLDAGFSFAYGQDIYNSFKQQMNRMGDYSNQSPDVAGRWKSASDPGNGLSRAAYGDPSSNGMAADLWVEDGGYTRLKYLTLGYDLPLKTKWTFIKGIKVNITGENLFTLTSYSGLDPEVISSSDPLLRGVDFGASPLPKSIILGVKVSL
ncbi:SusC/RagA family TonB-linked outer membrane protein [Niabella sp. 22666]|uniref:SusC/RagA family TonB-linked outer membrane protein n=1 Tax=Niabella sp. 22666 TaxID=3453954 RepID=UPI003F87C2AE